jgi:4-hydroxy-2-oxoheptanedioate aldolase
MKLEVRKNKILEKMRRGQKAYGAGLESPSAAMVELLGFAGLDFVSFDTEHGPFTPETIEDLCRVADGVGLTPTARVTENDPQTINNRFLDRGIMGVMVPHVNTAAEAKAAVNACRFGPIGQRSWGGTRGTHWNLQSDDEKVKYMAETNDNMLLMIQIETIEAINNLPEILKVEGIDLFAHGPNDLAQSMGYPGQPSHPKVVAAMKRMNDMIHSASKKLTSDVMESIRMTDVVLEAAKKLLAKR